MLLFFLPFCFFFCTLWYTRFSLFSCWTLNRSSRIGTSPQRRSLILLALYCSLSLSLFSLFLSLSLSQNLCTVLPREGCIICHNLGYRCSRDAPRTKHVTSYVIFIFPCVHMYFPSSATGHAGKWKNFAPVKYLMHNLSIWFILIHIYRLETAYKHRTMTCPTLFFFICENRSCASFSKVRTISLNHINSSWWSIPSSANRKHCILWIL